MDVTSNERLKAGIRHHQAGRLAEAEQIYREILQLRPNDPEALHLFGVLTGQRGKTDAAIELVRRAIGVKPRFAEAYRNLGTLLSEKGGFKEAGEAFQTLLQEWPTDCPSHGELGAKFAGNEYFQQAVSAFWKAIEIRPDFAEAHHDLGSILGILNRLDEAIAAQSKAIALKPGLAEAHYSLGILLSRKGRTDEALAAYRRAAELKPDFADACVNVGNVLRQCGRWEEAIAAYQQAIRVKPDFATAYFNLGQTLSGAGRLAESLPAFGGALRAKPDYVEAHVRMAVVLAHLQRFGEARAAQARAAELAPHSAGPLEALGEIMLREHRAASAAEQFRKALEIDPKHYPALNSLGNALVSQGKFEEAASCFRRFLEQCPESEVGIGYANLASTGRVAADRKEHQRLMAVLREPNSPVDNRVAAGFALGKFFDDAGRFDEAFACYAQANSLWKEIRAAAGDRYRPELVRCNVDHLIAEFDRDFFENRRGHGERSELPVFIVGMPRSGTTLVHQIAASHPRVHGLGERTDVYEIAKTLEGNDAALRSNADAVRAAAKEYVGRLGAIGGGASRVIDKAPNNVNWLGLISLLFPGARVICCRREARDTCLSCYFQWFSQGNIFSFDLAHCGMEYLQVDRLMDHWLGALPLRMLEVRYESLVTDLEGQSRRLIDFLGLPWHPACLEFDRAQTTVLTASMWQVRQPIYRSSVGRWRQYQTHLGPLMEVLGVTAGE
ncbi:MAG: tetratricopeptide repeat protein [Tepidisphaeraceae bacterium]|jgi:tetratricopeptide (TPR) repeat protein